MASKYFNIAIDLEKKIPTYLQYNNGKLPSESTLSDEYHASRQTIRSALSLLIKENYIVSVPGSGYKLTGKLPVDDNCIALIISSTEQYLYPALISSINTELSRLGFKLDIYVTNSQYHQEKQILETLIHTTPRMIVVEGIATAIPNPNFNLYQALKDKGCPILFINSSYSDDFYYFSHDSQFEGEYVTETLHRLGHEKVAGIFPSDNQSGISMYKGWLDAQWEKCNTSEPICGFYSNLEIKKLRELQDYSFLTNWLKSNLLDSTSIVCYNDEIAYWTIKALQDIGFSCPEDISITGADGSYLSTLSTPIISTFAISQGDYAKNLCNYISTIFAGTAERKCIIKRSFQDCPSISRIAPLSL